MSTLVLAQAGPPGGLQQFLPLVLILAVFYFLLIRPQQKRAKEHRELVANLKKNDKVVTASGMFGRIMEIADTDITLEIAQNVVVKFERDQVSHIQGEKKESGS
jgi:preprotein translocase subunit YajC